MILNQCNSLKLYKGYLDLFTSTSQNETQNSFGKQGMNKSISLRGRG